jgi:hypothetical protein
MSVQNGEEEDLKELIIKNLPRNPEHHSEGSSTTQVLETMRNLIVELQVFKVDNEKLKKAQEDQQEINEMLLRSIATKKIPKNNEVDEEVSKKSSKDSSHGTKKENNSSNDTHMTENKASTVRKRKQMDHLDGEFKKIKPSTFDGESRTVKRGRSLVT